jgi:hypothetical protein
MKIENITIDAQTQLTAQYNSSLIFMYSRTPLIFRCASPLKTGSIGLRVTNRRTGAMFEETRQFYNGEASFDLGALMRYLAPDVTTVMSAQRNFRGAFEDYMVQLLYQEGTYWTRYFVGIFGALNANESYRLRGLDQANPEPRRLWVNYPQTFTMTRDYDDNHPFELPNGEKLYARGDGPDYYSLELSLTDTLSENGGSAARDYLSNLRAGRPQLIGLSTYTYISAQAEEREYRGSYWLSLQPDLTPIFAPGCTYLRWLQRDGSFGYWLFQNGEVQVEASQGSSFRRFSVNPNAPSAWVYDVEFANNPRLADFTETRVMNLGTSVNTLEEFEYLAGLLSSPVVDRFILSGDEHAWERVNVMPSSQAYSRKRDTPRVRQIEITIQLPDRDTIKL